MRKIILTAVAMASLFMAAKAQFKVGIKAGGNLSNQTISVSGANYLYTGNDVKTYHAGLIGDLRIAGNFYLQPQLLWTRKGASQFSSLADGKTKMRINYVEVPVNVVYKVELPFGRLFGGAGAAYSYAINGKNIQDGHSTGAFSGNSDWKRGDISLSFTAGLEFDNGFFISMNSNKGLSDINKADDITARNKSRSLSVGYFIDWKKFSRKG